METSSTSSSSYQVEIDPARHELKFQWRLQGEAALDTVRVEIPTWVPGDYTFMQLARDLFEVRAFDNATQAPLALERDGWQAWVLKGGTGDITLTWRAYAYEPELGEPSGIIDSSYGIMMGARYLHCPQHLGPCEVTYTLPQAWEGTIHHPSGAQHVEQTTWRYPSYELLLDTPVVMGKTDIISRQVCGTPFYFVFVDRGVGFEQEVDQFVDAVAQTAAGFFEIFGAFPFEDYSFVLSLNPNADWGLEHLSSSMCGLGPEVFTDPDAWATGVRVCAHELFHAWNVRRLRPAPLGQLAGALSTGSFTQGLWMAEGFTRYYEFLSCARAGVYTLDQFFSSVVGYVERLSARPAYERVSATESSLKTYLTHSPDYPGRVNTCIDYYDKGMLIAFSLDALLRLEASSSLDEAFSDFYERFVGFGPEQPGYTTAQAVAFFSERLPEHASWIEAIVNDPGGLNVPELLERLGLSPKRGLTHRLGLMFNEVGSSTIYDVLDDSPAGRAGVAPGDVILGINGFAFTPSALTWAAQHKLPVTLLIARGHLHLSFELTPAPNQRIEALMWTGDEAAMQRLNAWLQSDEALTPGQLLSVSFYENFHGVETIL